MISFLVMSILRQRIHTTAAKHVERRGPYVFLYLNLARRNHPIFHVDSNRGRMGAESSVNSLRPDICQLDHTVNNRKSLDAHAIRIGTYRFRYFRSSSSIPFLTCSSVSLRRFLHPLGPGPVRWRYHYACFVSQEPSTALI